MSPSSGVLVITEADRIARAQWVNDNPLRAWRVSQKLTILEAAELLGVGMSMVQMYERGVHTPGPSRADSFAKLLGADWRTRWDKWLADRPELGKKRRKTAAAK
jgi:transcriptional regulator with XRE-family HTH domain